MSPHGEVPASAQRAVDRYLATYYRRLPVNATFTGIHAHDGMLPDWSPAGLAATAVDLEAARTDLVTALHGLRAGGAPAHQPTLLDCDLALSSAEIQLAELNSPHFHRGNPALHTGEAIFGAIALMLRPFAPAGERAGALADRLRAVPAFLENAQAAVGRAAVPRSWVRRAARECQAAVRLLSQGLPMWIQECGLRSADTAHLMRAAQPANTAFISFASWVTALPAAEAAACGAELLALLIARGHRERRSPGELLMLARKELADATGELQRLAHSAGGWPEVERKLAAKHPEPATYLATFDRLWHACRQRAEEAGLLSWPDVPLRFEPIPDWARAAASDLYFLYYRSPAPYDPAGTATYLVPHLSGTHPDVVRHKLEAINDAVIKLNHVVHHGATGHHVQNSHASRSASRIGRIAAVDCASRIGLFVGGTMAEGWACYATDLMEEVGFLSPLEAVAQQHARVRQLVRAVVDIELHTGALREDDAVQLHVQHVGTPEPLAIKEVTRTTMFPGTAVMYWLGTRAIHQLRARLSGGAAGRLPLKDFHERLLSLGSIPVPLAAELMTSASDP